MPIGGSVEGLTTVQTVALHVGIISLLIYLLSRVSFQQVPSDDKAPRWLALSFIIIPLSFIVFFFIYAFLRSGEVSISAIAAAVAAISLIVWYLLARAKTVEILSFTGIGLLLMAIGAFVHLGWLLWGFTGAYLAFGVYGIMAFLFFGIREFQTAQAT
jgi:hypothetical protein